jgi:hypothetical protein
MSGGIAPLFLTLALDGGDDQFQTPAALPEEKNPQYLLDRRLGGPHKRSGCCGVKKNLLTCLELKSAVTTHSPSLYQLSSLCFLEGQYRKYIAIIKKKR